MRGQKICPSCGEKTGPRSLKCRSCSYDFVKKHKSDVKPEESGLPSVNLDDFPGYHGGPVIYTPGISNYGNNSICPISMKNFNEIEKWCEAMYNYACQNGFYYSSIALKYLAKRKWPENELFKIDSFFEKMKN